MTRYILPEAHANESPTNDGGMDAAALTARRISAELGYPANGTDSVLAGGNATGAVFWFECADALWTSVEAALTVTEAGDVTETKPSGYVRNDTWRPRFSPSAGEKVLVALTDSIGWNAPGGTAGDDSYVAQAIPNLVQRMGGAANREFINTAWNLLHHGNGAARVGDGTAGDWDEDFVNVLPTRVENLPTGPNYTFYIALGANDLSAGDAPSAATVWARLEGLIEDIRAAHASARIIVATLIRRSEDSGTNSKILALNTLIISDAASAGADLIFRADLAHANFHVETGDTAGEAYNDTTHPSALGNAALAAALGAIL